MRNRTARHLLSVGTASALALGCALVSADVAGASTTPTITVTTTTVTCVDAAQSGCTDPLATIPANAQLQVICSRGGDYYVEDLANRAYEGYVPQSHVRNPPGGLGDCDTTAHPAIFAAANGLGDVGQSNYAGDCLAYAITMWQDAGTTLPTLGENSTAIQWWQTEQTALKSKDYAWETTTTNDRFTTPPRGALVFWWGNNYSSAGHVAIALGNGWVVSTSITVNSAGDVVGPTFITTIAYLTKAGEVAGKTGPGSGTEVGWLMPITGYSIQS